ncbi:S9 family peptidase [Marinilabiliaceae bacterium JC040]|nr:S9 family peptidase [Marinilabiliaceae bacterium JC040]
MKYLSLIVLAACVACTGPGNGAKKAHNYKTPADMKLKSDIMTPEVLWSFGRLGGECVSPDGKTVLYGVTYFNKEENKSYRDLYTVPVAGGKATQITDTPEKEFEACWMKDGSIAFLSAKSGSVQLYKMNADGSNVKQITNVSGGIEGFKFSPDETKLVYIKGVKLEPNVQDMHPDLKKADARIINNQFYRHWDHWVEKYTHIFVANLNAGIIELGKDIMKGEKWESPVRPWGGMEQINWTVDSKNIAYTCRKKYGVEYAMSTNSDIYFYNLQSGKTKNMTKGMMGYDNNMAFSPDGKYMAWESMERDGYEADKIRLMVKDLKSEKVTYFTKDFDQNVGGLTWTPDSKSLYFTSGWHATVNIYKMNIADGKINKVTEGIHDYHSVALAGNKLIGSRVSMSKPAEIYRIDPKTGKQTEISFVNKNLLDQLSFGKVEKRWIKTTDNKKMLTWVIYPPHFDKNKKYPALLYCEGGPQSTVSQFWSYRWNFQQMAANGYIVVAPNRRGLPSFGQEWNEQISKDYGGQNQKDYMSAIDAVKKEPFVDEDRLGAVGASYGGFSVYWIAGHHKKRFKAFIAHDGMFNFDAQYLETEEMWFVNWDLGGPFWDKKNKAAQRSFANSPHRFVQNWDTPILVIHGEKDYRIVASQGMQAFNAARYRGIPAQYLYFPEENHWVLGCQNGILWQRTFKAWLDKWLKK